MASNTSEKLKIIVKTSKHAQLEDIKNVPAAEDMYPNQGSKRGVVLVVNNIEFENNEHEKRFGADVDAKNLKELFTQMGFEWIYWENLTRKDMRLKLREFTNDSNTLLSEVDSCFVIVMSHGGEDRSPEETIFWTHDNYKIKASEIIESFSNSNCVLLQDKPKIIIFQVCRGVLEDRALKKHNIGNVGDNPQLDKSSTNQNLGESVKTISNKSDMLICYTTSPGFVSFRDPDKGAWFIQCFCKIFMNYAYNTEIKKLFDMVTDEVIKKRTKDFALQMPYIINVGFRHSFYLNPISGWNINIRIFLKKLKNFCSHMFYFFSLVTVTFAIMANLE
ncbi:caspase Dronc-like [Chrysoperla carnea]|uniref:caspase Dronc-like n=1 Tax=Chrysoperla carnea TaxID=189513 RepID=UPI001D07AD44|nr:caspase Dronc-like [Chrysoperla carnea]